MQEKAVSVTQSCRVLSVSRSGYYEALRRSAKPLLCKASVHLKAAFTASHQSYGSRRLVTAMENQGIQIGRYKVRSLMRKALLKPVWKRQYANHTEPRNDIADYVVSFYNCERLNSALSNLPPTVYEQNMTAQKPYRRVRNYLTTAD